MELAEGGQFGGVGGVNLVDPPASVIPFECLF